MCCAPPAAQRAPLQLNTNPPSLQASKSWETQLALVRKCSGGAAQGGGDVALRAVSALAVLNRRALPPRLLCMRARQWKRALDVAAPAAGPPHREHGGVSLRAGRVDSAARPHDGGGMGMRTSDTGCALRPSEEPHAASAASRCCCCSALSRSRERLSRLSRSCSRSRLRLMTVPVISSRMPLHAHAPSLP